MSTTRYSLALDGQITSETPVSIGRPRQGNRPLTISVVVGSTIKECLVIPGETIKGRLRRVSAEIVRQAIIAHRDFAQMFPGRETPWDLEQMYVQLIGGIKRAGKEDPADLVRSAEIRKRNPVLSLYGAAHPVWMSGNASFDHAIANTGIEGIRLLGGVRRDPLRDNQDLVATLTPADRERWLKQSCLTSQRSAAAGEVETLKRKLADAKGSETPDRAEIALLDEQCKEALSRLKAIESDPDYSNAVSRPLDATPAIAPGTAMPHRMAVNGGSLTEIGLFIETLRHFAADPRIGGHRTTGYGRIAMDYTLRVRRMPSPDWWVAGHLRINTREGFVLDLNGDPVVEDAIAAWTSAAANILSGDYDVGKAA
jgi:CRISPR/Cas system CSM-associated protein Csm3 (group 7 of RAMP superfamily)